ncbi:alpha-1,4-glucan--maltose-1-phosphate maltosyltransferase [candidate division FCPU426 bacterium]|nr:alpha-1,4-glucan--maltose-1-phosphate maltosyltransferase [candidate division FCPU426 bacterium]
MPRAVKKKPTGKKRTHAASAARALPVLPEVIIENISPCIDNGRFPAKAEQGRVFTVEADIFKDGHDIIKAALWHRPANQKKWQTAVMTLKDNDRWQGSFTPDQNLFYQYTIAAWMDPVATWLDHVEKKAGRYPNIQSEADEGLRLLDEMDKQAGKDAQKKISELHKTLRRTAGDSQALLEAVRGPLFQEIIGAFPLQEQLTVHEPAAELMVDRPKAVFGAWYEMFPRSQGKTPGQSATFADCIRRLPEIKKMGFDVIYLPPIHPIGTTNRKGPNNTLKAGQQVPGSPWAIGNAAGGHKSVHPDLGTLKDFASFVKAAQEKDLEIALDFAIQCSPDHPYVQEHPEWFYRLPDGTVRYAENPPKKYEDIYPVNFRNQDRAALWQELKSIVEFWIQQGVKIFRVDNPHTKPLYFWSWLIREIQKQHPEVFFLAEAFTRPKVMKFLAKAGFTQSYTYFTWRNAKKELREYFEELTQTEMRHYFRGNLFTNTPDILHAYLQQGGRPAFKVRATLAATLLPTWGIYSGYELCEHAAREEGSEEYLNSEKYDYKVWDWDRPGNIKEYIALLNRIRRENPALQEYANLRFFESTNDQVLCYGKWTQDKQNILVVCVNLDPHNPQEDRLQLPVWEFGLEDWQQYSAQDLVTGREYRWQGREQYVRLDPQAEPAHIFLLGKL